MSIDPPGAATTRQGTSRYIAFLDECGDHSLDKVDKDFPLFVLATVVVERQRYLTEVIPRINALKLRHWDHEGVNLHSREIRKAEGPFSILQNASRRQEFMEDLSSLMSNVPFTLFIAAIRKADHLRRYAAQAQNPYELALTFTFERLVHFLEGCEDTHLPVVAEARGKNEDRALEAVFYRLLAHGTYFVGIDRCGAMSWPLLFENKLKNIAGIQLADLCAYPCARQILKPGQPNRAYDIARSHIYHRAGVSGWKVFP